MRFAALLLLLLACPRARAVRPFITDDARVVGNATPQVETWLYADRTGLQHWMTPALGLTDHLELTLGLVHGLSHGDTNSYSIAGSLVQLKILLFEGKPNGIPSFAISGGIQPPSGYGAFTPSTVQGFVYLALTASFGQNDRVVVHGNLGVSIQHAPEDPHVAAIGGVGAQVRLWRIVHGVLEVVQGDSYAGNVGGAVQSGVRFIFSDHVQLDATGGSGTWGHNRRPPWGTIGLRLAGSKIW